MFGYVKNSLYLCSIKIKQVSHFNFISYEQQRN